MKVETVINGNITLVIIPESDLDEQVIKQLIKQETDITEIRQQFTILNKTFKGGLLLSKKGSQGNKEDLEDVDDQKESV